MYHLVIELRPGDFMPIDISILSNDKYTNFFMLETIDQFTKKYTKDELMDLVIENNLVPNEYFAGELKIVNENKYRYPLITIEDTFSFESFFDKYMDDKQMMNKFMNIYHKYSDDTKMMKEAINQKSIRHILNTLFLLPYEKVRFIYIYLESLK